MAKLMVEDGFSNREVYIGGTPLAPIETKWPHCSECNSPMQFLAQLPLNELGISLLEGRRQYLLLFQCNSDPGMCDEWDAYSGGNAALLVPTETAVPIPVPTGETLLSGVSRIDLQEYDDSLMQETPDDNYCNALDMPDSKVLGKTGGTPLWIQNDETPACSCGERMLFVAQLEAHGGGGINFGDAGSGYAFVCSKCPSSAMFLWQCG